MTRPERPQRVWVRWTYFAVNMNDDAKPRLRGTEDYVAYPNGLVLRRMTYESLMPQEVVGYSTQPVELFGAAPVAKLLQDLFPRDAQRGDYHTHAVLDLYSDRRYDIYWGENGAVRRSGDDATLAADRALAGLCSGAALPRRAAVRGAGQRQRFSGGEEPVDRPLHAGRRGRLRVGDGTLGSLADRLAEFTDVPLGNRGRRTPTASDRSGSSSSRTGNGSGRSGRTTRSTARTWNSTAGRRAASSTCCSARPATGTTSAGSAEAGSTRVDDCAKPESIADLK